MEEKLRCALGVSTAIRQLGVSLGSPFHPNNRSPGLHAGASAGREYRLLGCSMGAVLQERTSPVFSDHRRASGQYHLPRAGGTYLTRCTAGNGMNKLPTDRVAACWRQHRHRRADKGLQPGRTRGDDRQVFQVRLAVAARRGRHPGGNRPDVACSALNQQATPRGQGFIISHRRQAARPAPPPVTSSLQHAWDRG